MTRRVEALATPTLLRWARESAGFDGETAATKVHVKPERLASWENGETRPTITQLRKLAHIYKRPIAVFYLPAPPADIEALPDYRRLPGEIAGKESPELRYEIRRATSRREIALELLAEAAEQPPDLPIEGQLGEDPERLGARIREVLGVGLDLQRRWRGPYDALNGWRAHVEDIGILVLQMTDVEVIEARAFSIGDRPLPVIVLNLKDTPNGRVFSLLHELAHLAIHRSGICDLDDIAARPHERLQVEQSCNAIAAAALLPRGALLDEPVVQAHRGTDWLDNELSGLSARYGVSREALLRRLLDLGKTDQGFYERRREEFLVEYEEARRRRAPGFAPPAQVALASAGPAFTGLVLSSWSSGQITASDVSDYLGVRLKHVPRIESQLLAQGRAR